MLNRLTDDNRSFSFGSVFVESVNFVSDMGVVLEAVLTMKQHINNVVSIGSYHLYRLKQLCRYITQDAIKNSFAL